MLARDLGNIPAKEDIDVPDSLVEEEALQRLVEERRPQFVPVGPGADATPPADDKGIVLRRLSNGVRLNYRVSVREGVGWWLWWRGGGVLVRLAEVGNGALMHMP